MIVDIFLGNEDTYKQDTTGFIQTINELFNSIKHSIDHEHTYNSFYPDEAIISSFYIHFHKGLNEMPTMHCHRITEIMKGFRNTILRIFANYEKEYKSRNNK